VVEFSSAQQANKCIAAKRIVWAGARKRTQKHNKEYIVCQCYNCHRYNYIARMYSTKAKCGYYGINIYITKNHTKSKNTPSIVALQTTHEANFPMASFPGLTVVPLLELATGSTTKSTGSYSSTAAAMLILLLWITLAETTGSIVHIVVVHPGEVQVLRVWNFLEFECLSKGPQLRVGETVHARNPPLAAKLGHNLGQRYRWKLVIKLLHEGFHYLIRLRTPIPLLIDTLVRRLTLTYYAFSPV